MGRPKTGRVTHHQRGASHSSAPARAAPPGAAADSVVPGAWSRIHPCVERVIEVTEKTLYNTSYRYPAVTEEGAVSD